MRMPLLISRRAFSATLMVVAFWRRVRLVPETVETVGFSAVASAAALAEIEEYP